MTWGIIIVILASAAGTALAHKCEKLCHDWHGKRVDYALITVVGCACGVIAGSVTGVITP